MLDRIVQLGAKSAVITSARVDGHSCVVGRRSNEPLAGFQQNLADGLYFRLDYDEIPVLFHGTGDIFLNEVAGGGNRRKGVVPQIGAYEPGVGDAVELLEQLTQKNGKGKGNDDLFRVTPGH